MRRMLGAAFLAVLVALAHPVRGAEETPGQEKILSFHSDVTVLPDSSLQVTETIQVQASGDRIRRGIFRDFPTLYETRDGDEMEVGFAVADVRRDGSPENYAIEQLDNGVRVRIGKADVLLSPGVYTYAITYRTDRQLGFFDDHDELYWNVTGNGWEFPIDLASASVRLPEGVPRDRLSLEAYTGPEGAKGGDYQASVGAEGTADFVSVHPLGPNEGLTIVVSFPKGHVTPPPPPSGASRFVARMRGAGVAAGGLAVLLLYYLVAWVKVGRDPEKGQLVPLYQPPAGLSPAAARYLMRMGYDQKAFAAALIGMAVKGRVTIDESGDERTLIRGEGTAPLEPEEEAVSRKLFGGGDSVALVQSNHAQIGGAVRALKRSLSGRLERTHFVTNRRHLVPGIIISVLAVVLAVLSLRGARGATAGFMALWLSFWSVGVTFLALQVWHVWGAVRSARGMRVGAIGQALFTSLFALPFFLGEGVGIFVFTAATSATMTALVVAIGAANVLFHRLLAAPTRAGRALMDRIEGFREFLSAVEGDRLDRLYPAGRTPELFERYLPWALALDVEQEWAERFADVLAGAGQDPGGYAPSWYRGGTFSSLGVAGFASSIGGSLASAVSSSSTAPGSSSGSGGGGSSGGGGGGGGGGGW